MDVDDQELERRLRRLEEAGRRAGLRMTNQRRAVFRAVAGSVEHPDAEQVYRAVRQHLPNISLDTVYRTLWTLRDLGVIGTLGPSRGGTRFDANLRPHHHFVCVRCGLTRDFASDALDRLAAPASAAALGRVESTHVEVRGVCHDCGGGEGEMND